jgi:hypothetical protein
MRWSFDREFLANFRIPAIGVADAQLFLNISRVESMKKDKEENGEVEKIISGFHVLFPLLFVLNHYSGSPFFFFSLWMSGLCVCF